MRISGQFQYDVARFVIQSRRTDLLERWLGDAAGVVPEKSVQGFFERAQAKIAELPQLLDPDFTDARLRYLAWFAGWDDSPAVDFVDGLDAAALRKLIALSVPLWQQKGSAAGVINAIRIFAGKTAILRDWHWHRWIVDETGEWIEARGLDPYLVGGLYTEADESLAWLVVNRDGLTESDRRLVYDLLTYTRVAGEHFGVVFAAFADDFARGLSQWAQIGTSGTATAADGTASLLEGAALKANATAEELATWTPFQRSSVQLTFSTTDATEVLSLDAMISEDGADFYRGEVAADGTVTLYLRGVSVSTTSVVLPTAGTTFQLELAVEPVSAAEVKASVRVGGELRLEQTFLGVDAFDDSSGGVVLRRTGATAEATAVDDVLVLATPNRVQYIGQAAITPTFGFGGASYIADPDPGVEPFAG